MNKDRLLEAFAEHDPDGKGEERVREAIDATTKGPFCTLKQNDCGKCILAHAWKVKSVVYNFFYREALSDAEPHRSSDVVVWFDQLAFSNQDAAYKVLEILNDEN